MNTNSLSDQRCPQEQWSSFGNDITSELQTNNIIVINPLYTIILSRLSGFFRVVVRAFLDEVIFSLVTFRLNIFSFWRRRANEMCESLKESENWDFCGKFLEVLNFPPKLRVLLSSTRKSFTQTSVHIAKSRISTSQFRKVWKFSVWTENVCEKKFRNSLYWTVNNEGDVAFSFFRQPRNSRHVLQSRILWLALP